MILRLLQRNTKLVEEEEARLDMSEIVSPADLDELTKYLLMRLTKARHSKVKDALKDQLDDYRYLIEREPDGYVVLNVAAAAVVANHVDAVKKQAEELSDPEVRRDVLETAKGYADTFLSENDDLLRGARESLVPEQSMLEACKRMEDEWRPTNPKVYDKRKEEALAKRVKDEKPPVPKPKPKPVEVIELNPPVSQPPKVVTPKPWRLPPPPVVVYPYQHHLPPIPKEVVPAPKSVQALLPSTPFGLGGVRLDTLPCLYCHFAVPRVLMAQWVATTYCPSQAQPAVCLTILNSVLHTWNTFKQGKVLWTAQNVFAANPQQVCSNICLYSQTP